MKLSQLTTDKALDVLCSITPFITNITKDEALTAELKRKLGQGKDYTRAEIMNFGVEKINILIPIILKDHRPDVLGILAVLNSKDEKAIAKQNIIITMNQIKELLTDRELLSFFNSCVEPEGSE